MKMRNKTFGKCGVQLLLVLILMMLLSGTVWANSIKLTDESFYAKGSTTSFKLDGNTKTWKTQYYGVAEEWPGELVAFCVENAPLVTNWDNYALIDIPDGSLELDKRLQLAAQAANYYYNSANKTSYLQTVVQVAVWEIMFDTFGGSLNVSYGEGKFFIKDNTSLANAVNDVFLYLGNDGSNVSLAYSPDTGNYYDSVKSQDYIIPYVPPQPTPEPSTMILLGTGLFVTAVLRRKMTK